MNNPPEKAAIIPAIDLIDGQVVRLSQGDYDTKEVFAEDPVQQAIEFEEQGFKQLHLVDLDGAKAGRTVNSKILKDICSATDLQVDYGGGIRNPEQIEVALEAGAAQVVVGSAAIKMVEEVKTWLQDFGVERFIIAADVKDQKIATEAWQESSNFQVVHFIRYWADQGVSDFLCTDITKDGELKGPNTELYAYILEHLPDIDLIASGGVTTQEDLEALAKAKVKKAVVGKALYKGLISRS